ncbi:ABC transporter permease [Aestuariimicrobium ganziense]|uniref:ABC transporter permease n=1 Tax=Aestuariimicrobium ganziense TaxID=2773677 RepID=UPI001941AE35|nr:ABC transporter permease [Aestuariimicrobium ganziense]
MSNNDNEQFDLNELEDRRGQGGLGDSTVQGTTEAADAIDGHLEHDPAEAVGRGEGVGEAIEVEGLSQGKIVLRRFVRHIGALFGLATIIIIALLSFLTMGIGGIDGLWHVQDPNSTPPVVNGGRPTLGLPTWLGGDGFQIGPYPFGQNTIGNDNFAQVMTGIQTSLIVMFVLGVVVLLIGTTIGSLSGYYRGKLDNVLMRFTDLVITLPVIVLGAVLGKMIYTLPTKWGWSDETKALIQRWMPVELALALGLILWPGLARLVRSEFLSLREREFVDSARVAGATNFRIITKHILPNTMGVIVVNITLLMSASVVLETALSFLGFGINYPSISLGGLISANQSAFDTRPWLFWWPGIFIILLALSVNFIGDGLRDAFDPRTKRVPSQRKLDRAAHRAHMDTRTTTATASGLGGN